MSKILNDVSKEFNNEKKGKTVTSLHNLSHHDIIKISEMIEKQFQERQIDNSSYESVNSYPRGVNDMNKYVEVEKFERFKNHVDTKFDNSMKEFKDEMRAMRTDMNNSLNSLRSDINTNVNNMRTELQTSISKLPTNSDVENMLLKNNEELDKEAKQNRNTIIGWTIAIVSLGFTIAKTLGWL